MTKTANDVAFAYAQLGIEGGASLDEIRAVLTHAAAYRFSDPERVKEMGRLVEFFAARAKLGGIDAGFDQIKKNYHRLAMKLHPDRNKSADDGPLKEINAAYRLIDDIHREAKIYYQKSADIRAAIEERAREQTAREKPEDTGEAKQQAQPEQPQEKTATAPRAAIARKYMAASIPRNIRTSWLSYLPLQTIIGCKYTTKTNDVNHVFDIIMLPELHFNRARNYMALPDGLGAHLQYGKFSPAYTPQDTQEVIVPADEPEPEKYARDYFRKKFGLTGAS